jgi:hypothetical protein
LAALALAAIGVVTATASVAAADLHVIRTHNVRDIVITLLATAGEWTTGANRFVIEFDSAPQKRLIDAGTPTLTATLPDTGPRPLQASARLARGDVASRYVGTITLPRAGEWGVTVVWSGAASKGSTTFSIPVQPRTR